MQDAELGRRYADKLLKVFLIDGSEEWLLVHIEAQGQRDADFARRMFVYAYRLFDRYAREIVSLAVLTDQTPGWRPRRFAVGRWGSRLGLTFPSVKLTDYAIFAIEEGLKMPYLSYVERRGEARGAAVLLRGLLEERFGELPAAVVERLEQANGERLLAWSRRVLTARTVDEVFGAEGG